MEYSAATVRKWKQYLDHGDIKKIALLNGVDRDTVSDAIKNKKGSIETAKMITDFIDSKKAQLK